MRTELWDQFDGLVSASPRLLATVTAHNADGTSSLTTYDGGRSASWVAPFPTTCGCEADGFWSRLPTWR